jgi:hypothetical protein
MIRGLTVLASVFFISVTFVSSAELVSATGPELRRVNDPARDHGLNLGFAEVSGAFLGDVTVVIEDRSGKELVNTLVDGPWFFVPLPAGTYHVKATFDDQVKHIKNLRLAETQVTMMVVYWDLNVPATQMLASARHAAPS